jgi:Protein of unknown function (DUF3054)
MRATLAVAADAFFVLLFVVIGRANHHAGESLAGVASTAWPFLAGLAIGELATRAWRSPFALIPTGIGVWLATVAGGQLLRIISGQGTEFAFVVVSAAFVGLFLLGWRMAAMRIPAVRARTPG